MTYKTDYYSEEAKKVLRRRATDAELFIKAWGAVKRVHKKDGGNFSVLSKNFSGANIIGSGDSIEARVSICDNARYNSDELKLTPSISELYEPDKFEEYKKAGRLIERGPYMVPYIVATPDEVENLIRERIEYWQGVERACDSALLKFDEYADKIITMRDEAKAFADSLPESWLFRAILEERRV